MGRSNSVLCFCLSILTALSSAFAASQTIEGQIRDSGTHVGLQFVKVELLYRDAPVDMHYTDSDGRFHFANKEPGSYTISATLPGYSSAAVVINSTTQSVVDLELNRSAPKVQNVRPQISVRDYAVPEKARKEFERAGKDIARQDCVKAIVHLENALRLYDQNASALNDLGNCRRQLGDLKSAEAAFKGAMALSDGAYIVMNLAETYTVQRRFNEAESVLMETIRKTTDNGDVYYTLAVVYFKQGRLEDAEAAALQADSRNHRIPDLHLLLAMIYKITGPDKVASQLELYLKEAPNGPQSKHAREILKALKQG